MSAAYGVSDSTSTLRRVLVRPPTASFAVEDPTLWNYSGRPDLTRAQAEHRRLVEILESAGVEVLAHAEELPGLADSIYVFDPMLMTPAGAVALRMGKARRRGEGGALAARLGREGVPLLGALEGPGTVEGGDLLLLDATTVALGLGFRTDPAGRDELARLLAAQDIELISFDLPCLDGANACLHLRSLVSPLAPDLALVLRSLLPVRLFQLLERRFALVDVAPDEVAGLAANVLALGPRRCLMLAGNPRTRSRLQRAGCEVLTYRGDEISLKGEGGPTCLTLPLWRDGGS